MIKVLSIHHRVEAQAHVTKEKPPAWLPLTFDLFNIPPVHLARNHGANMREESEEVRRHTTDQTLELMRSECEARHCLLPEPVRGRRTALPNQRRGVKESHMTEYFDHLTVSITHFSDPLCLISSWACMHQSICFR